MSHISPHQFANVARNITTAVTVGGLASTMAIGGMTHEAPVAGYSRDHLKTPLQGQIFRESRDLDNPTNVPAWNKALSRQFEGFRDIESKPKSAIPSQVAVVPKNGDPYAMGFDKAYRINNDEEPANNVWTVGYR